MEVKILEDKKDRLLVELRDGPAIALNVLKDSLWANKNTKAVGAQQEHPLLNKQRFVLETDGEAPRKVIAAGIKTVKKDIDKASASLKGLK